MKPARTWVVGVPPHGLCNALVDVVEAGDSVGVQRIIGACSSQFRNDQAVGDTASSQTWHWRPPPKRSACGARLCINSGIRILLPESRSSALVCPPACSTETMCEQLWAFLVDVAILLWHGDRSGIHL